MGSSPLTRGKLLAEQADNLDVRLIPAHAGKTTPRAPHAPSSMAHPRSRGENSEGRRQRPPGRGSSPLTRGKRAWPHAGPHARRLIPAHAGKTRSASRPSAGAAAHPRSRGENGSEVLGRHMQSGSSPLTRGKRWSRGSGRSGRRLIPAHAGKTRSWARRGRARTAHPRSRGENTRQVVQVRHAHGSSPLTRGKLRHRVPVSLAKRLIPAHAGKTRTSTASTRWIAAHPRSRGENPLSARPTRVPSGSSPLTRGKPFISERCRHRARLIPAHAGKTIRLAALSRRSWAHPRSRGENDEGQDR